MKTLLVSLMLIGFTVLAAEPPVKNYPLVNQDGKPFQVHDLKGNYVMVTFVYSRCPLPKMCPLTMTLSNRLVRKWKDSKDLKDQAPLKVLAVTLDPANDTPMVLKKFGKQHNVDFKQFTLATGDAQVLSDFAGEFNVIAFPAEGMLSHNMKNILIGPDLVPIQEYKENEWKPEEVLKKIRETALKPAARAKEPAAPPAPGT